MRRGGGQLRRLFPTPFLLVLLAISVLTNIILVGRLKYPDLWRDVQLAFIPAPTVTASDHVRGSPDARVTVIEYADFQCPFCADFHAVMRRLLAETNVRWVYRHFPIDQIHPLATRAAEAAECSGEQGRFWEYADVLFERQADITFELFTGIARDLDLDVAEFEQCFAEGRFSAVVSAHREEGDKKRIAGTPTFYVGGKRFDGTVSYEELKQVLVEHGGAP